MKRVVLLALLAWCPTLAAADGTLQPAVQRAQVQGWNRVNAVVPGNLRGYASVDAGRTIYLLVEPVDFPTEPPPEEEAPSKDNEDEQQEKAPPPCPEPKNASPAAPLELYRLQPEQQELVLLRDDVPGDGSLLYAADLDGDGAEELFLKRPGQFMQLQRDGASPPMNDSIAISGRLHAATDGFPAMASAVSDAHLRLYRAGNGEDGWEETTAVALPLTGKVQATELSVRHAVPRFIGRNRDGHLLYATTPEAVGKHRLQVLLIALNPTTGEAQNSDCWAGLPGPEMLLHYDFLRLEGRPFLLVQTMPSDKLSMFGERLVRLFPLEADRSHLGVAPLFAVESRMNLWHDGKPIVVDVNRDGRMDLVMGYWKGLMTSRFVLDAYLREPDGSLRESPRSTAFDVKDGETSYFHYGEDLDGDSLPDLLLRSDESWQLHSGLPSSSGKKLVDRKATILPLELEETLLTEVEVQLSTAGVSHFTAAAQGAPKIIDMAGGRAIVLTWPGNSTSPGALQVLWRGDGD